MTFPMGWMLAAAPAVAIVALLLLRHFRNTPIGAWAVRIAALAGIGLLAAAMLAAPLLAFAAWAREKPGQTDRILSAGLPPLAMALVVGAVWLARRWARRRD